MVKIIVMAHNVSVPLYNHRSKEFSERMYFMAKQFDEVHMISKERSISDRDKVPIKDELASNLIVHKVRGSFVSSNLDVLRVVKDMEADVVFADGIGHGACSLLCKKKCGVPLITFIQGYEADLKAIGLKLKLGLKPTPGLLSKIFALYDSIVLRASDRILCVSPGLVKYVQGLLAKKDWNKIKFIPHSLQYVKHIPKEAMIRADEIVGSLSINNAREFSLIMVVGIGSSKGTDIALEAHKYIGEKIPNTVMILVGKTIDPKYMRMARELKLEDKTLFLEGLPREHVLALLSRSSVFLCPSFSEGFSWAVAEAMALGVPVIAYANKSLRDAVNKGAVVGVRTTYPEDYARECISLIRDEKRRRSLVEKAKAYIKPYVKFSEEERLKLICDSIKNVLLRRNVYV